MVDRSGAGVETTCSGCNKSLVVPQVASMLDREYVARSAGSMAKSPQRIPAARVESAHSALELKQAQSEIAELTQRLSTSEAHAAELAARQQQTAEALELAQQKSGALTAQLAAREKEIESTRAKIIALEREQVTAKAEISRLQDVGDLHLHNCKDALARLALAEKSVSRAEAVAKDVLATAEKLAAAEERGQHLGQNVATLTTEIETMRREFAQTESGRTLLDLRARMEERETQCNDLGLELSELKDDFVKKTEAEKEARAQFESMRTERDSLTRQLDSESASGLKQANEILRGVLDRQKSELAERYAELRRLKKAEFASRILYAILAILIVAFVAAALHVVPRFLK